METTKELSSAAPPKTTARQKAAQQRTKREASLEQAPILEELPETIPEPSRTAPTTGMSLERPILAALPEAMAQLEL